MSDHIELHDSRVVVKSAGSAVVLELRPAYIHHWVRSFESWRGEGRSQSADMVIAHGVLASSPGSGTFEVSNGWFKVGSRLYDNMVPVPLEETAAVRGRIVLVNAEPIDLCGDALIVRLVGEPEYVEDLPPEWAPKLERCPTCRCQRAGASLARRAGKGNASMLYMIIENFRGDAAPVYRRFRDQGRLTPDGLAYVSSWVTADLQRCYQIVECDDPALLEQWIGRWKDLIDFEVIPVITSSEAAAAVRSRP